ncbi:uncharacterized protein TNCV_4593991 [Trichonephila clavipes]|uniref:Uncharacterized protein n=1 Tax=Trichonephila clavipes TaxID=2585209 RepID=A0A8X6WFM9_TRICX|nr:uncharacterized protein TNCV_4593991 [Trichonephila clavipes]
MKWLDDVNMDKVNKSSMLSLVHKVFDHFGLISPMMLCPKNTTKDMEIRHKYIQMSHEASSSCAIHTFVDGSKDASAKVTFLRLEKNDRIGGFLLAAKSRVASLTLSSANVKE